MDSPIKINTEAKVTRMLGMFVALSTQAVREFVSGDRDAGTETCATLLRSLADEIEKDEESPT